MNWKEEDQVKRPSQPSRLEMMEAWAKLLALEMKRDGQMQILFGERSKRSL